MLLKPLDERSTPLGGMPLLPASISGIDESLSILEGRPRSAQRLLNFCARSDGLHSRSGQTRWAAGLPGPVESIIQLMGEAVFACAGGEIWEIRHSVKIRHSSGHMSNRWLADTLANPALKVMVAANGIDPVRAFHSGSWRVCNITNVDSSTLMCPVWYANRMFFLQHNTQELWYLKPGAYEGPASVLPIAGMFQNAAPIVAIATMKGGDGSKSSGDMLAVVTGWGEVAVFAGTDPDLSTSWSKVGVYSTAMPMGWRPLASVGGDLYLITTIGILSVQGLLPKARSSQSQDPLTKNIIKTYGVFANYHGHANWQIIESVADKGVILLNWPDRSPHLSSNGAWSETSGMEATAWADDGSVTYRGTANGEVWQYGTSSHDDGKAIDLMAVSHYQRMAGGRRIIASRARPSMRSVPIDYHVSILSGYQEAASLPFPSLPAADGQTPWNFPWDPPTALVKPKEREIWEWKMASGSGSALASVFAARTRAPLVYRGVDIMERMGGNV